MSGIFGIVHFDGRPVAAPELDPMAREMAHRGPDGVNTYSDGAFGMGQLMLRTTPEALEEILPRQDPLSGLVITADARLDNRLELIRNLRVDESTVTDSDLILTAYRRWGEACVDYLLGDFAFAIFDPHDRRLFLARDHMGLRPIYYYLSDRTFVFASSARGVVTAPGVPCEIDEGRIADYLLPELEGINQVCTFFHGVKRLPPAHLGVLEDARFRLVHYWQPDAEHEIRLASDEDYADALEEVLSRAVNDRLRCNGRLGSMLSGGVDSSTIVGLARGTLKTEGRPELRTYSAVSDSPDSLETRFIQQVLDHGGLDPVLLGKEQLEAQMPRLMDIFGRLEDPFDGFMIMQMMIYLAAFDGGTDVVLDGVDGDIVASLTRFYPAWLLSAGKWRSFVHETKGSWANFHLKEEPLYRTYKRFVAFYLISSVNEGSLYQRYSRRKTVQKLEKSIVSETLTERAHVLERLLEYQVLCRYKLSEGLRRSHGKRIVAPYLSAGIERYGRVAAACGIENRSPFLDKRVIELCLSMPWQQKVRNGWPKYTLRKLAERVAPQAVAWRKEYDHLGWDFTGKWMDLLEAHILRGLDRVEMQLPDFFRQAEFSSLKEKFNSSSGKTVSPEIWRIINLYQWMKQFSLPATSSTELGTMPTQNS